MRKLKLCLWLGGLAALSTSVAQAGLNDDWIQPQKPFRIYGNSWYVGTHGLSAILITSPSGHVLIDGTLPENAKQIEANIETLGFHVKDIKRILNSHAHADHAGAIASLAAASGAPVSASAAGAKALMVGGRDPDDPQYGEAPTYPPVSKVDVVEDGGSVRVGDIEVQAHYTPLHTPGSTSWTWQSCEAGRCLHMAYADSITAIANATYRFGNDAGHPQREQAFRNTLTTVAKLPCDILITPHPDASDFLERAARRDQGKQPNPLVNTQACKVYATEGSAKLDKRLQQEQQGKH